MNSLTNLLLIGLSILNGSFLGNQITQNMQDYLLNNLPNYQQTVKYENINSLDNVTLKPYPYPKIANANFDFKAISAIAYDIDSGVILAQKDKNKKLPMASLTKIFTALVILRDHKLDEEMTVPEGINLSPEDQKLSIKEGQKYKIEQALRALMIYSANDMAQALAIWDSGSIEKFSDKMNRYAKSWQLKDTHFVNPDGKDDPEQYSSAEDILKASLILLNNKELSLIVNTQKDSIESVEGKVYNILNTNRLLSTSYVYGIKTGFTANAGQSLAAYSSKNNHRIITVVLNSPDRFKETNNLINYVNDGYQWK